MKELFASEVEQIGLQRLVYGLGPLVTFLEGRGIDCQSLFDAVEIPQGSIGDPYALMGLQQEKAFTQAAITAVGDPGLGLAVGPGYHLSAYGVWGLAMISSATLREGLLTLNGLHALTWTRLHWRQMLDGDTARTEAREVEMLAPCLHYMLERDFCGFIMMCNEMLGTKMPLQEVRFVYLPPAYASQYETVFGCPVRFGAERNELLFDAHWLDAPLPQANKAVWQVCRAQCEDMMARLAGENSYARMIECLIVDRSGRFLTLSEVADKMHLSPRTLRRKLAREDTNFQKLVARIRSTLAKELLLGGKLTVDQVAERLDYSDAPSFCHAFKRWTGKTPSEFL